MANTSIASANILEKWERNFFREYVRESGFNPYMKASVTAPFVVKRQLISGGQQINIPLVKALSGNGTGTGTLVGNEEALDNFGYQVKPVWRRHAVVMDEEEEHISSFEALMAAKEMLKVWSMDDLRDKIIFALGAMAEDTTAFNKTTGHSKQVDYAEATAAQRNTWTANNADRVLFGNATSNYNATFATAAANVTSAMTLGLSEIALLKRIAKARNTDGSRSSLRPLRTASGGREYFVAFCGSNNFANIKVALNTGNLDGRPRDPGSNPYFQDGDLIYDGVIIREIPEIFSLGAIGASSANVAPVYLCGAQALGIAWGRMPKATTRKEDDYEFIKGVGTKELRGVEKLIYNNVDHGVVTGFFGADTDLN